MAVPPADEGDPRQEHGVECPCCGWQGAAFADFEGGRGVECPSCRAHGRHRLLWHFFRYEGRGPLAAARSVLHSAPEPCLQPLFAHLPPGGYVTTDLTRADVDLRCDLQAIPLPDCTFDLLLCSHVLEHVDDDRQAMRELHRVLRPGGLALVCVPLDESRDETYEDPTVVDPKDREREFLQFDHVRLYGNDMEARLREAGFDVVIPQYARTLEPALAERHGMNDPGMWVCARRVGGDPVSAGGPDRVSRSSA